MILYLHGFRSSPASHKAQQLQAHLRARGLGHLFRCPQLPPSPRAAIALAQEAIATSGDRVTLVGSSLGGYYATWLAQTHGLKAVLVNPAVVAPLSLGAYVGPQTNLYTGEVFEFKPQYVDELRALEVARLSNPENILLLVETGDELLDYREAVTKYAGARQVVIEGGDHGFQHWGDYLDAVLDFAGLGDRAA